MDEAAFTSGDLAAAKTVVLLDIPVAALADADPSTASTAVSRFLSVVPQDPAIPGELSGGQQQRVAIARALAGRPKVLIADELTGQLDADTARLIMRLLRTVVRSEGICALVATHDLTLLDLTLLDLADEVLTRQDGLIERG